MSVHKPITESGIYFITFTCHKWLQLIKIANAYDLVYKWFDVLNSKGHRITGYVTMPNHLHLLIYFTKCYQSLNLHVGNGKRFMAYEIINRLKQQNETHLLKKLQNDVQTKDKSRGKKHEVWINSFDVKECRTEKFILQKLHYIHNNPCTDKWKLADSSIHYLHSSASFYICGRQGGYPVKDYREYIDNKLWKE